MNYDEIRILTVSEDNLKSWIIQGLHSFGGLPKDLDVVELKFGEADLICRLTDGLIPLHIKLAEEVQIIRHNGKK